MDYHRSSFEQMFRVACFNAEIKSIKRALRSFYKALMIARHQKRFTRTIEQLVMESGLPRTESRKLVKSMTKTWREQIATMQPNARLMRNVKVVHSA